MNKKSMIEVALEVITKSEGKMSFAELFAAVKSELGLSDEQANARIGEFYTELTLDSHFVALPENTWDLRARHTLDGSSIDIGDVYTDIDNDASKESEDAQEEAGYNASVLAGSGAVVSDDFSSSEEGNDGEDSSSQTADLGELL